jgi:hypothetical protein
MTTLSLNSSLKTPDSFKTEDLLTALTGTGAALLLMAFLANLVIASF